MDKDTIIFNEVSHPVRTILTLDFGEVCIGLESLSDALCASDVDYSSPEVRAIDEEIFFYISDDAKSMLDGTDESLERYVSAMVS